MLVGAAGCYPSIGRIGLDNHVYGTAPGSCPDIKRGRGPVDTEILNGKLYILGCESGAIWEISLPTGREAARTDCITLP